MSGRSPRRWLAARLHRRLLLWFGATIVATAVVVWSGTALFRDGPSWHEELERAGAFVAGRFAEVWAAPERRRELAAALARELSLGVVVHDAAGDVVEQHGAPCRHWSIDSPVVVDGRAVGAVALCTAREGGPAASTFVGVGLALLTLWAAAGLLARRLTWPLREVARVARELGEGKWQSRVRLSQKRHGEAALVGEAVNDMAARIERQFADQKELLASVSHEMRTPLGHMRVLLELLEDAADDEARRKASAGLARELKEADDLVGELLVRSRLDVGALEQRELDARAVAADALERAGEPPDKLVVEGAPLVLFADATSLLRALANLLDNARRHGGGVAALALTFAAGEVRFAVDDEGPGFPPGDEERAFEKYFSRADDGRSLGLGLALVRRVAEAHGGRAFVERRASGGARVGLALPARASNELPIAPSSAR